jgi:hypothetical protein
VQGAETKNGLVARHRPTSLILHALGRIPKFLTSAQRKFSIYDAEKANQENSNDLERNAAAFSIC